MEEIFQPEESISTKKSVATIPNHKLKRERELRGWSQAMVAEKIGAQPALVNRWENGYSFPSPYYREKLCQLFEKDAEALGLIKNTKRNLSTTPTTSDEANKEATSPEESIDQAVTRQQRIFSRRNILLGITGGVVASGGVLGAWMWSSTYQHSSPQHSLTPSPGITTMYIYKPDPPVFINFVSWSSQGTFIACATGDKTVKVLEAASGNVTFVYRGHTKFTDCAKWSPDGTRIASCSSDKTVQIWKPQTGELLLTYKGHTNSVYCVSWSHDGARVASSGADKTVQIWDAFSGKLLTTYRGHTQSVWNITWSPDDASIATCGLDGGIHIWNPVTGVNSPTFTYQGPSGTVTEIDWSPNSNRIVSTHIDSSVHIWDTVSGYAVLTYTSHTAQTETAKWSPDGKWIASGADDKTVQIWNPFNGKRLLTYQKHTDQITEIAWAPDSKHIASGSRDDSMAVCKVEL